MNSRRVAMGIVALASVAAAVVLVVTRQQRTSQRELSQRPASAEVTQGFSELALRDEQIAVWKQALAADSVSALAMGQLAALYMQRAREGGSYDDYLRAESFARKSMGTRMQRNGKTIVTLVSVLLAQHRFTEAHDIARDLVKREGDIPQYRSLLGEVSMEVGDYATARVMFDSIWAERAHLSNAPRLARWLELNNHTREARRILVDARNEALSRRDVTKETQAWFELRLGDFDLRAGRPRAAEESFRAGLKIEPNDPRLLAAMARLSANNGDYRDAIDWGERAIGEQLDPATLGIVGDAYAALGDTAKSNEYFHTLEVAVTAQPGAFHRAWSLYLLDHDLRVSDVLRKAQDELTQRKDIYGYDLVAWALYKSGRVPQAAEMMKFALQLNTPDPLLLKHQEAIAKAVRRSPATVAAH